MTKPRPRPTTPTIRCAIYTRKSTDEGLDLDFNSLDAQRESGEAYIKSQANEGWVCLPDRYDDGGFTGGNMDRPALKRLLVDIEAGKVDCVVVYKVDRLSRSLLDFSKIMETFDSQKVSFVSVTQLINSGNSMGRLMLNVLLSFAQFEREIISERTRDKIAAARRKGKWSGGPPILGYDVAPEGRRLIVNDLEALQVRQIFETYLERESILATVADLDSRGWKNKRYVTKKGETKGGRPYTKASLHALLTNVLYLGKLRHRDEVYEGEHERIVDPEVWRRVQVLLSRNGKAGGSAAKNKFGALLKGLLRCTPCDCSMVASHTTRPGGKRYRYYTCSKAQKRGWKSCPSPSVPAGEIERFVVEQIRAIGRDPNLLGETIDRARAQTKERMATLDAERTALTRDLAKRHAEVAKLVQDAPDANVDAHATARLADLQEQIRAAENRLVEIRQEHAGLGMELLDRRSVEQAMATFDPVWEALSTREQARALNLLIEQIDYDGGSGKVAITYRPSGIETFAAKYAQETTCTA